MTESPKPDKPKTPLSSDANPDQTSQKIIPSQQLFGEEREVYIEHEGEVYRLRITRRNKLILQK